MKDEIAFKYKDGRIFYLYYGMDDSSLKLIFRNLLYILPEINLDA